VDYKNRHYRSKGEYRIADFLDSSDIKFKYEYPLAVRDNGLVKIWYPDFQLSDYGTIIEYFGVGGDAAYDGQMAHKIDVYKQAGIDCISMLESSFSGDWESQIFDRIKQSLESKIDKFNGMRLKQYSTSTV